MKTKIIKNREQIKCQVCNKNPADDHDGKRFVCEHCRYKWETSWPQPQLQLINGGKED